MIGGETRIVDYAKYCLTCVHCLKFEWEDPCHDCLQTPVNQYSERPINYQASPKALEEAKNNKG